MKVKYKLKSIKHKHNNEINKDKCIIIRTFNFSFIY